MASLAASISKHGVGSAQVLAPHSNVFVGNLEASVTEEELTTAFAPFGEIASCLVTSKAGRPCAFVKMAEDDGAVKAIAGMNGKAGWVVKFANYDVGKAPKPMPMKGDFFFKGGKGAGFKGFSPWGMKGGFDFGKFDWSGNRGFKGGFKGGKFGGKGFAPELREDESDKPEPPASDNLYIKHLPLGITEDMLRETFGKVGEITELRILRSDFALEGAALIRYASEEQAVAARTGLDDTAVQGSTPALFARSQTTRQSAADLDHVYLKNVPTNTTDEKLKDLLGKYGEVKWTKVMRTSSGQTRIGQTCGALVEMGSPEQASAAIEALNDQSISYGELVRPMKVRFAANKAAAKAPAQEPSPPESPEDLPQIPGTRLAEAFSPP